MWGWCDEGAGHTSRRETDLERHLAPHAPNRGSSKDGRRSTRNWFIASETVDTSLRAPVANLFGWLKESGQNRDLERPDARP